MSIEKAVTAATALRSALIEAYLGFYEDELKEVPEHMKRLEAIGLIKNHRPKERLAVYLEWNGIIGYTGTIFAISQGEL